MKRNFLFLIAAFLLLSACTGKNTIYISPDGSDQAEGTADHPFLTLGKAKEAVRNLREENPSVPVVVNIKGGLYHWEEPVVFSAEDSGTREAPVVYRAMEGEEPVFTGGRPLESWQLVTNPENLKQLDPKARGNVFVVPLETAGIKDFGDPIATGKRPELFCNGQLQTLARWPDQGFIIAGKVKGETELPPAYTGKHGTVEGVFEYIDERLNRWAEEKDPRLGGYWYWDWSEQYQTVEKIDTLARTIFIEEPYHHYGYRDSLRFFGLNLLCELDTPGEWYLDRSDGFLYWYPPEGIVPSSAEVTLSLFNDPWMIEMKDCSHLTLEGLTFRETRGNGIRISGGADCRIADCRLMRMGADGIHIDGGKGHGVTRCLLRDLGCSGMWISGGDRKTLTPGNHFVEHTVVENFSLFKRTYQPAVYLEGCGNRITHNCFRNSSSSAMRLEGNDLLVEYNKITHVVSESDDQGGLDMWYNPSYRGVVIRFNHWLRISGGTLHGAAGVRLDDMISGVHVYGNIFEECGAHHFGGVQIHGGKDNLVENNLFYKCFAAVSFSSWGEERWLKQLDSPAIKKKIYETVDIRSPLYQDKYPGLKNIRENADVNEIKDNLLVDCKNRFLRANEKQIFSNNPSVEARGNPLEHFCAPEVLKGYGLDPIPWQKIGPEENPWMD